MINDILTSRLQSLASVVRTSFGQTPHVDALVVRLAIAFPRAQMLDQVAIHNFGFSATREELHYQGFPRLAALGFGLDIGVVQEASADGFIESVSNLQNSGKSRVQAFSTDDIALLGVCLGLAYLDAHKLKEVDPHRLGEARSWILKLIDMHMSQVHWTMRIRLLGGDLLDGRGRLKTAPPEDDIDAQTADVALSRIWPRAFSNVPDSGGETRGIIISHLLTDPVPQAGDLERAAFWQCMLSDLVSDEARSLVSPDGADSTSVNPAVFISYTHDTAEHSAAVLELSNRLRSGGVDCQIDQYEDAPLKGWPRWMEEQIERATYVLIVCTETYLRRYQGKETHGKGLGATWEGGIITQELYDSQGANAKFIPVVLSRNQISAIPLMLRGTTYYDLSASDGYERLYRRLTEQPATRKPPLGIMWRMP